MKNMVHGTELDSEPENIQWLVRIIDTNAQHVTYKYDTFQDTELGGPQSENLRTRLRPRLDRFQGRDIGRLGAAVIVPGPLESLASRIQMAPSECNTRMDVLRRLVLHARREPLDDGSRD